jgi:hypothetical protein
MKHAVIILSLFAMMGAILSCTPPAGETPYSASVTSVSPGSLNSYSGTGSLPGDANDNGILENVFSGISASAPVITGLMSDSAFSGSGAGQAFISFVNLATGAKSQTANRTLDMTPPDLSGNISLTNEPIGTVGVVDSLTAQFTARVDQTGQEIKANGNGTLDAAITVNTVTATNRLQQLYKIENGKINASAKAKASGNVSLDSKGVLKSFSVDYNLGVAISAGFSVSSDAAFVGKYVVDFIYSEKKAIDGTGTSFSDPTTLLGDIQLSITVNVYDNTNTRILSKTYKKDDIIKIMQQQAP